MRIMRCHYWKIRTYSNNKKYPKTFAKVLVFPVTEKVQLVDNWRKHTLSIQSAKLIITRNKMPANLLKFSRNKYKIHVNQLEILCFSTRKISRGATFTGNACFLELLNVMLTIFFFLSFSNKQMSYNTLDFINFDFCISDPVIFHLLSGGDIV